LRSSFVAPTLDEPSEKEDAMSARMCVVAAGLLAACAEAPRLQPTMPPELARWCTGDLWRGAAVVLGPETIASVEPLYANLSSHGSWQARLRGAIVHVKPGAGVTREMLEAMIECHRQAVARGLVRASAGDPYALDSERMSVKVDADASGLEIRLSCDSIDDAKRVLGDLCISSCPPPSE
jgi:hypothetical protein